MIGVSRASAVAAVALSNVCCNPISAVSVLSELDEFPDSVHAVRKASNKIAERTVDFVIL
jgi:hypothetical protein